MSTLVVEVSRPSEGTVLIRYADGMEYTLDEDTYATLRTEPGARWRMLLGMLASQGKAVALAEDKTLN